MAASREVEHGIEINFVGGAQALADAEWVDLDVLYRTMTVEKGRTRKLVDPPAEGAAA